MVHACPHACICNNKQNKKIKPQNIQYRTSSKWLSLVLKAVVSAGVGLSWHRACLACTEPRVSHQVPYKLDTVVHTCNPTQHWGAGGRNQKAEVILKYIYWVWGQPRLHKPSLGVKTTTTTKTINSPDQHYCRHNSWYFCCKQTFIVVPSIWKAMKRLLRLSSDTTASSLGASTVHSEQGWT